jgi:hypothetical protein
MNFRFTKAVVFNRGKAPDAFLDELVTWGKTAPDDIFAPRPDEPGMLDIYNAVKPELGPWESLYQRRGAMLEVMRVLAGFESSWDWTEGVDTSRLGADTPDNAEAGAWQVSYDARHISPELSMLLTNKGVTNGVQFQRLTKFDHYFAMEFVARLMRHTTHHNGPLYKDEERNIIRKSLRGRDNSIYPWISRQAVEEFKSLIMPI